MKKCIIIAVVLFSSFGLKASAQVVCPDAYVCVPVCPVGYTCTPIIPTGEATSTFVSQLQNQIGQLQALVDGLNQVYSTPVVVQPVQSSPVVGSVPQPTQTVGNVPDNSPSFSVGSEICRGDVGGSGNLGFVPISTSGTFTNGKIYFTGVNNHFGYTFTYQNILDKDAQWYYTSPNDDTTGLLFSPDSYTYTWNLDDSSGSGSFVVSPCSQ
jgi:hypothetical protein